MNEYVWIDRIVGIDDQSFGMNPPTREEVTASNHHITVSFEAKAGSHKIGQRVEVNILAEVPVSAEPVGFPI